MASQQLNRVALLACTQGTAPGVLNGVSRGLGLQMLGAAGGSSAHQLLPAAAGPSLAQVRGFSSRLVDLMTLPDLKRDRARTLQDLQLVGTTFLKHRGLYTPLFSPHGLQLVPKSVLQPSPVAAASTAARAPGATSSTSVDGSPAKLAAVADPQHTMAAAADSQHRIAAVAARVAELRTQVQQAGMRLQMMEASLQEWAGPTCEASPEPGPACEAGPELLASQDKTRVWRRLKMKKHKVKKLRKAGRYKTK